MALAKAGDFSTADALRFGRFVGRLSNRMAGKGVFFWPGLRRVFLVLVIVILWGPIAILIGAGWVWGGSFWSGEAVYAGGGMLYFLLYLLLGRRGIQQTAYRRFLSQTVQEESQNPSRRERRLADLPPSRVVHVLCATELTSGQPFYMSRDMVLSPLYGRGRPNLFLSQSVYASAAFPIAFPPLRVRSARLSLTDGRDDQPPKRLLLSDGGVFNNLGTETFSARSSAHVFLPDPSLPIIPHVDLVTTPKSKASRRTVKLIPWVVTMLRNHPLPLNPDGFVFSQPGASAPLSRTWFNRRILKPAAKRAGIHPLPSAHDLRHTAGAIASKAGMHPMAVKEMMGHSSIRVTYDVYGHLFPTMHQAGIAAVEAAFGETRSAHRRQRSTPVEEK